LVVDIKYLYYWVVDTLPALDVVDGAFVSASSRMLGSVALLEHRGACGAHRKIFLPMPMFLSTSCLR
jgi:hypothetical protein